MVGCKGGWGRVGWGVRWVGGGGGGGLPGTGQEPPRVLLRGREILLGASRPAINVDGRDHLLYDLVQGCPLRCLVDHLQLAPRHPVAVTRSISRHGGKEGRFFLVLGRGKHGGHGGRQHPGACGWVKGWGGKGRGGECETSSVGDGMPALPHGTNVPLMGAGGKKGDLGGRGGGEGRGGAG